MEEFQPLLIAKQCSIEIEADPALAIEFDPDALQQAMLNLVDNAVKYGPAGQRVLIRVEPARERVLLAVEDQGPGIPDADLERVWQPFHRASGPAAEGASPGGTGIGLSVIRDIVARHGGECWFEAADPGPGLRAVIQLPADCSATSGDSA